MQFAGGGGRCLRAVGVRPCPQSLHRSSGAAAWTQSADEHVCLRDEEAASQSQAGKREPLLFQQMDRETRLVSSADEHIKAASLHPPPFHLADDDVCFPLIHSEMFDFNTCNKT